MMWIPPDLTGRTYAVTGGTSGIGRHIAAQLADAGAHVAVLGRDARQASIPLDLADLDSVAEAASRLSSLERLDGLILNAGTNAGKERATTRQGFELAVGTNHLGHFALTALTMPLLKSTPGSRVVSIGSIMTRMAAFSPEDLQSEQSYSAQKAYTQSKHAVSLFAFELDRRLRAAGMNVLSLTAHPGLAVEGMRLRWPIRGKDLGAQPAVRAAADPAAESGLHYGPRFGTAGKPVVLSAPHISKNSAHAAGVWDQAERLTGITFDVKAGTR
ncbi:SDR family NAD(P)-dependent oxidoreductase [Lentzea sp. NPDC051838]|uniref:SDR family NAD(P)-dependent oxidoreductase n=1 Tax=Lentzea sp. NPDC051838 TaxID=3154849 RepID=UPI00341FE66D